MNFYRIKEPGGVIPKIRYKEYEPHLDVYRAARESGLYLIKRCGLETVRYGHGGLTVKAALPSSSDGERELIYLIFLMTGIQSGAD